MEVNAQAYREGSQFQYAVGAEAIGEIPFKGDEKVLDIACGDGRLTAEIAKRLPQGEVIGIDISEEMIAFAQRSYPSIRFIQQDATCLSIEGVYDCITAQLLAHFFHDKKALLEGWRPFLKPGGYLLLTAVPAESPYQKFLYDFFTQSKWGPHFDKASWAFTSIADYLKAAEKSGYQTVDVQVKSRVFEPKNIEEYKKSVRGVLPMLTPFPNDLVEPLLDDLAQSLDPYRIQGTQEIKIPLKTLLLVLKR